jgi:hypothetical protein
MSFGRAARRQSQVVLAALFVLVLAMPARGDELTDDFHAAVEQAAAEYRAAKATLETRGQQETAAAVHRFRETWQGINERFGKNRPAAFADDEQYDSMFMLVDMRLVGVLLVIDMGNRDAAREGLAPIEETLSQLSARSAPR